MAKKGPKFYAVRKGRAPGIYLTWEECQTQVTGFAGNQHRSFKTRSEAEAYMGLSLQTSADVAIHASSRHHHCAPNATVLHLPADAPNLIHRPDMQVDVPMRVHDATLAGQFVQPLRDCLPPAFSSACLDSPRNHVDDAEALEELTPDQMVVARAVLAGHNVFFTGLPGSGKSFVLERVIKTLQSRAEGIAGGEVVACASTGAAALHIGGATFHSFLGCGAGASEEAWNRVRADRQAKKRIRTAKVLLLDEVSMFSGDFLEAASSCLSSVRQDPRPFGGLQMVLCGDFLQLPPVKASIMAFECSAWQGLQLRTFVLKQNHRQDGDTAFQDMLLKIRVGQIPAELRAHMVQPVQASMVRATALDRNGLQDTYGIGFELLQKMGYLVPQNGSRALVEGLRVGPPRVPERLGVREFDPQGAQGVHWPPQACRTRLVCTNAEADGENSRRLSELLGDVCTFSAEDDGDNMKDPSIVKALKDLVVPSKLDLKVGARVMLLKNLRLPAECKVKPTGERQVPLVNGSLGTVIGFSELGPEEAGQRPPYFLPEGSHVCTNTVHEGACVVHQQKELAPIVEFSYGYRRCIGQEEFSGQVGSSGRFCRRQVPLRLAWAVTVHKSQGMTLETGEVCLARVFDHAQTYVALSRFRRLEDVHINALPSEWHLRNLSVSGLRAKAVKFHQDLERNAGCAQEDQSLPSGLEAICSGACSAVESGNVGNVINEVRAVARPQAPHESTDEDDDVLLEACIAMEKKMCIPDSPIAAFVP